MSLEERLAAVLEYAVPNAKECAAILTKRYVSFAKLARADYDELAAIEALGGRGAFLIRLAFAIYARKITDGFRFGRRHKEEKIAEYLRALFFTLPNETVYALMLDEEGRVISSEYLGEGTVNYLGVLPRKVLEVAIRRDAKGVILAHNHPGGFAEPSCEDVDTTACIAQLFKNANKKLVAHYIIAGDEHYKLTID